MNSSKKRIDYTGFIFVVHEEHGMLLLHCTRKPKKGHHFQLPGGHIDDHEFEYVRDKHGAEPNTMTNAILLESCMMGAARELYEETGIDVRSQLDRLEPAALRDSKNGSSTLTCMLKNKCYFYLSVNDDDFPKGDGPEYKAPMDSAGGHLKLKLSHEHSGFKFVGNPHQSISLLALHSGGAGSMALRMSMNKGKATQEVNHSIESPSTPIEVNVYNDPPDKMPLPKRKLSLFSCCWNCC